MSLKLRNEWQYMKDDWWAWEAFIDDFGSGDLDKINHVEYVLHPTFRNPIRKIKERKNGFRFKTEGWGTFLLKAFVHMKNGEKIRLDHYIELKRTPPNGVSN